MSNACRIFLSKHFSVSLAVFLLAAGGTQPSFGQTSASPPKDFDLSAIDTYIASYVREKGIVGLSVAVMQDGQITFAKGYGHRSLDPSLPVEPETSFAVGSITKQFTCACVLLLAEDGKLSVRDPVSKYYPNLTRASDITLLDLMNHTSGYPDYYPLDFVDRRLKKPIGLDGLLKDYAGSKLDFEPGSRYSYSNTGYILLGGIVEKVTGEKFGDFLQQRILSPLGMKHSRFGSPDGLPSPARGYNGFALGQPEPAIPEGPGWIEAAGGLWASASDLLRWDLALTSGKILKPESYELMIKPRQLLTGKLSHYGCGLQIDLQNDDLILRHGGGVSGFVSSNAFIPRPKFGLVVLSNTEHISATPLRAELFNLLMKEISIKEAPEIPRVNGPPAKQVVLDFFKQMQNGRVDHALLGEEFSHFLSDEKIKSAAIRLEALGDPEKVEADPPSERGGLEVTRVKLVFKTTTLRASMYRSPDGKIEQLLFYRE
ncbi:MAG TPA: serine hydrolase domain-containing protein [Pirellulaceae bacterium]|jgi:CubicO group peptidase (beta-lactamase class C family)